MFLIQVFQWFLVSVHPGCAPRYRIWAGRNILGALLTAGVLKASCQHLCVLHTGFPSLSQATQISLGTVWGKHTLSSGLWTALLRELSTVPDSPLFKAEKSWDTCSWSWVSEDRGTWTDATQSDKRKGTHQDTLRHAAKVKCTNLSHLNQS